METLRPINLGLRFLLELGALVAVGYWGWQTGEGAMRWLLAAGAVLVAIVVWLVFVSPKPKVELARPVRLIIEFGVWAAAALALYATTSVLFAVASFVVALVSGTLNYFHR
ncbi:MAG TPA: YrdB family protein [Actinomycetota bacterium]|nr:YrdB family protein [Actinomycetota bacterium]